MQSTEIEDKEAHSKYVTDPEYQK